MDVISALKVGNAASFDGVIKEMNGI